MLEVELTHFGVPPNILKWYTTLVSVCEILFFVLNTASLIFAL